MTSSLRKLTLTALFIAAGVASAHLISIPIGPSRCFPVQSAINILLSVCLGTRASLFGATLTSLLRNLLGTGSLLAFPGSMFGALLSGILYRRTQNIYFAALGEIIGTGLIASLFAVPFSSFLLGNSALGVYFFVWPFTLSALGGATLALLLLHSPLKQLLQQRG